MKKGDIVRRRRGWSPMRVVRVRGTFVETVYCGQDADVAISYSMHDLVVVTDPHKEFQKCPDWFSRLTAADCQQINRQSRNASKIQPPTSKEDTMPKLYQTNEATPRFGTYLTTNSVGKMLLEMKGTNGAVELFDKADLTEVRPYTVAITFAATPGSAYHYLSRKGDVEKGDLIVLTDGSLARIVDVDTKSDKATKQLAGRKVMTVPFGEGGAATDVVDNSRFVDELDD